MSADSGSSRIERLIGVYDANGSTPGEIAYWVGARLGLKHCALCEITHGVFREKAQWQECERRFPVPFEALHLDEISPDIRALVGGSAPCVVAEFPDGTCEIAIDRQQLERCEGQPEKLAELIEALG